MSVAQVNVKWVESAFSVGRAGSHSVWVGKIETPEGMIEAGFRPAELLLLSIGSDFNSIFSWTIKARGLVLASLETTVHALVAVHPNRFSKVELEINATILDSSGFELSGEEIEPLIDLARKNSFVTNSLQPNLTVVIRQVSNPLPGPVLVETFNQSHNFSQDVRAVYSLI